MKKGLLFAALAAGTAAVAYYVLKNTNKEEEPEEEVTFIEIKDGDEEETAEETEEPHSYSKQTKDVAALYPYLSVAFVDEMLKKNDQLNSLFEIGTNLLITHSASFDSEGMAETFAEILEEKGFSAEIDGTSVKSFHKCVMENERIISDILNVSNQVCCLGGEYLDYHVEEAGFEVKEEQKPLVQEI